MAKTNFYVPNSMDTAIALSVTSEATGHPIESALDRQLNTYWAPTTTASNAVVLDLQDGQSDERITNAADRTFSSTVNWANVDMDTWTITGGTMHWEGGESGQTCELAAAGLTALVAGETYRLTYTATGISSVSTFRTNAGQSIGTISDGTAETITFTATLAATKLVIHTGSLSAAGTIDNLSLRRIDKLLASPVRGFALWISNYDTEFGATCGVLLEYSDDNSSWMTYADPDIQDEMTYGALGDPLRVYVSASTAESRRYWRLTIHDAGAVIHLAGIFLLTEYLPDAYSIYPQIDEEITFRNSKKRLDDGRLLIDPGGRTPTRVFARTYKFYGTAKYDIMKAFFMACRGGAMPLILEEDSTYYLVYCVTEEWKCKATDYQYYELALEFETLPYVADGDVI